MTKRVVIVGDLPDPSDRAELLRDLSEAHPDIEWDWLKCNTPAFNLPDKLFKKLLAQLQNPPNGLTITVVKLNYLNGRESATLYRYYPDPVLTPSHLQTSGELAEWLRSDDAALVREPPWQEPIRAAALLAILAKLIRNKSWNGSKQGHNWTKEADLLGQSPVNRDGGVLLGEAEALLGRLSGTVLLCKGGKQGKTPQGWCVLLEKLPVIKRVIEARSLQPLREENGWEEIIAYVDQGPNESVRVDDDIVNETVRSRCRDHR